MPSVITAFCFTNRPCRHAPNYFRPICIQLFATDILSKKRRLCGNLISLPERSSHNFWTLVRWSPVITSPLKRHQMLPRTSACPLIFHVPSVLCLSSFISVLSFSFTSSFSFHPPLHPSCFSPHLWLSSPGTLGIITQCTGWRFIHYHIKGFLMPHWLAHCYCRGWL